MAEKSWTIIQFLDDATVEAVPASWVQGDQCYWPTYAQEKLQNAIRKCEMLNTCWPTHKVKVFRSATYSDYMTARVKAKVAEETSDLNTEAETTQQKRKRIQKVLSSSDDSIEERSAIASPPKIHTYKFKKETAKTTDGSRIQFDIMAGSSTQNHSLSNSNLENVFISKADPQIPTSACQGCIEKDKILNSVKSLPRQIHLMRELMTDTLQEVKELRKEINNIDVKKNGQTTSTKSIFNNTEIQFPLDQDEDFEKLESLLQNEDELANAIPELSKLGGGNVYDFIKRALHMIMTDQLAIKFSWLGRKGKRSFNKSALAKLLLRAADATGLPKTNKEVEVAIQTWLKRASDRRSLSQIKNRN